MYETWLRQYSSTSYALVLDTRDTFFQRDPFFCGVPFFLAFHAIDATLSPWPRRLDGVEARGGGLAAAATRLALHAVAATHSLPHAIAATPVHTPRQRRAPPA